MTQANFTAQAKNLHVEDTAINRDALRAINHIAASCSHDAALMVFELGRTTVLQDMKIEEQKKVIEYQCRTIKTLAQIGIGLLAVILMLLIYTLVH